MIDAVGEPQSVLVLGGSSEIALATVEALPRTRLRRVVLAGRPSAEIDRAAAHLGALGIPSVETTLFDAADTGSHGAFVDGVFDDGDIDIVLLCFGVLGDQAEAEADPTKAVEVATINYTGAVSVGLNVAQRLRRQGHGKLVVLSSVAGDRARRSNYVYGSTKAGLDAFAQGLGDALVGSGASVLIVRPGMVRTRMSDGLPEAPMTTDPEVVGTAIVQALRKGKSVIYVPGPLRFLMTAVKAVPRPLFRRLPQ
ncbi:MAG: decaprenylphospho-beta-D-erythro-pentofuranosid-2-ulose 2-reductase [Rubrivirga sp.]|nr:decaprenylphospho-beta-D-erythro-pentofuranosid-2-ulose 2-reductase [Rubrivirga sp.]PQM61983.1 MAG: decaprenylphospho-beta-D-erythro-pentofuranosid-2-ulose 2-reductase [Actinomycetales bacterium]